MKQAEAFEGGFLRDLDEDEKKRFTPSELLLYKVAVEYRYMYLYELTCTDLYCLKVSLSGGDCSLEKC